MKTGEGQSQTQTAGESSTVETGEGQALSQTQNTGESNTEAVGKSQSPSQNAGEAGDGMSIEGLGGGNPGQQQATHLPTKTEQANEEYSEQVTNLVLEYLENQLEQRPSDDLLQNLGWSEEELRAWYEKWKGMSEQGRRAAPHSPESEEWKENLRSLGITSSSQTTRQTQNKSNDSETATESRRFSPLPGMEQRIKSYSQSIAQ